MILDKGVKFNILQWEIIKIKNLLTSLTKDQSKTRKLVFYASSANCNLVSYILLPFERICVDEKGIWGFKMMGK